LSVETMTMARGNESDHSLSALRMRQRTDNPALATGALASALPLKMPLAIASK
jgi:hypothetical protein